MERDRAISKKFLTHRVSAESIKHFSENRFPATFGSHLECLCKMQKCVLSRKRSELERFQLNFGPTEYLQSMNEIFDP